MTVATSSADLGDEELMRRVQADDPDAFAVLLDRFGGRAYRVALAFTRERTRAEDIVQEAFLSMWRNRATYDPGRGALGAWMTGIVRNRAIDSARRNGRHDRRRADEELRDGHHTRSADVGETAGERDEAAELRRVLVRLPEAQREVIVLAYFGELSTTEIASELALPLGTVKARIRLGLGKLRAEVVVEHS